MRVAPMIELSSFYAVANEELPEHRHDRWHLCYLVRGELVDLADREPRPWFGQTLRVSRAGQSHRIRFGSEGGHCILASAPREFVGACLPETTSLAPGSTDVGERLRAALADPGGPAGQLVPLCELFAAANRLALGRNDPPAWVLQFRAELARSPERPWHRAAVARESGVHPDHVSRAFRTAYGMTVGQFVNLLRVDLARRLLVDSPEALTAIAHRSGFADQSHMTRSFRRWLATTPSALRTGSRASSNG